MQITYKFIAKGNNYLSNIYKYAEEKEINMVL